MDDEEYIQEIETRRLQKFGYSVVAAKNSEEAVAEYKKAVASNLFQINPFKFTIKLLAINICKNVLIN